MKIRNYEIADHPFVQEIHQQGIDTGIAAFDIKAYDYEIWNKKYLPFCRLISYENDVVTGWAALTKFSDKEAYSGLCGVSIYIHKDFRGKGIGEALLKELINESEKNNIWTLQSLIISENIPSIKLHEKCGFRIVGYMEKAGFYHRKWHNVTIMEKRSCLF